MDLVLNQEINFFGKVDTINTSTYDTYACSVINEKSQRVTVRINKDNEILVNKIYYFETTVIEFKDKLHLGAEKIVYIEDYELSDEEKQRLMKIFYNYAPIEIKQVKDEINSYVERIENKIIKDIVRYILDKYESDFYLYPAATKFHHAYISGLAYHTVTMLKLASNITDVYNFLNNDLLFGGVILHDICKVIELTSYEGPEYSKQGRLIGHITLGVKEISNAAVKLGYSDEEEVLLLEHIVLSHHYYGNYGSPKKPNIPEALIIHFIDNIDSKMCVLGEELELINQGDFTSPIGVLDREKYYKHKLYKINKKSEK